MFVFKSKKVKYTIKMPCRDKEEGGNIKKLLVMEFADNESAVFDDIMNMLQKSKRA